LRTHRSAIEAIGTKGQVAELLRSVDVDITDKGVGNWLYNNHIPDDGCNYQALAKIAGICSALNKDTKWITVAELKRLRCSTHNKTHADAVSALGEPAKVAQYLNHEGEKTTAKHVEEWIHNDCIPYTYSKYRALTVVAKKLSKLGERTGWINSKWLKSYKKGV